eukprot:SM000137S00440  [mRNA]  locus=s137:120946:125136:+ [translate_table: standard]
MAAGPKPGPQPTPQPRPRPKPQKAPAVGCTGFQARYRRSMAAGLPHAGSVAASPAGSGPPGARRSALHRHGWEGLASLDDERAPASSATALQRERRRRRRRRGRAKPSPAFLSPFAYPCQRSSPFGQLAALSSKWAPAPPRQPAEAAAADAEALARAPGGDGSRAAADETAAKATDEAPHGGDAIAVPGGGGGGGKVPSGDKETAVVPRVEENGPGPSERREAAAAAEAARLGHGGDGGGGPRAWAQGKDAEDEASEPTAKEVAMEDRALTEAPASGGAEPGARAAERSKRILRPRAAGAGPPDPRPKRGKDADGGYGYDIPVATGARGEPTVLQYCEGEGMPELVKLLRDSKGLDLAAGAEDKATLVEIRIAPEALTTANRQVRARQLWGTELYTDDSDIVAAVSPADNLHRVCIILGAPWQQAGGGSIEMKASPTRLPAVAPTVAPMGVERTVTTRAASQSAHRRERFVQEVTVQYNLCNEPWLKYSLSVVADRGLKQSQFTSARLKKGDVLYLESHCTRYELAHQCESSVCEDASGGVLPAIPLRRDKNGDAVKPGDIDKGAHKDEKEATVKPGHAGLNVVPDRSLQDRGKLCDSKDMEEAPPSTSAEPEKAEEAIERFRFSECLRPLPLLTMRAKGTPLPPDAVKVLEEGLRWEELQWAPAGVWVRNKKIPLARAQFFPRHHSQSVPT